MKIELGLPGPLKNFRRTGYYWVMKNFRGGGRDKIFCLKYLKIIKNLIILRNTNRLWHTIASNHANTFLLKWNSIYILFKALNDTIFNTYWHNICFFSTPHDSVFMFLAGKSDIRNSGRVNYMWEAIFRILVGLGIKRGFWKIQEIFSTVRMSSHPNLDPIFWFRITLRSKYKILM